MQGTVLEKQLQIKTDLLPSRVLSQLTISKVAMTDSGEYLCLAVHSAGQAKKTLLLTVQVTGINHPPPHSQDCMARMCQARLHTWRCLTTPAEQQTSPGHRPMMDSLLSPRTTSTTNHTKVMTYRTIPIT